MPERSVTLHLREARNGEVRVAGVSAVVSWRKLTALGRWARFIVENGLNECDLTPFTCATYTKTTRLRPCPTCRARAALGFRPVKGHQRRKKNTKPKKQEV